MSYENDFRLQWQNVRNTLHSEMNREIKMNNFIDIDRINKIYAEQKMKWSSLVMQEGLWLNNLKNKELAERLKGELNQFHFKQHKQHVNNTSSTGILAGILGGLVIFVIFNKVLVISTKVSAITAIIVLALGIALDLFSSKNKSISMSDAEKNAYLEQLDTEGNKLAEICAQYDK